MIVPATSSMIFADVIILPVNHVAPLRSAGYAHPLPPFADALVTPRRCALASHTSGNKSERYANRSRRGAIGTHNASAAAGTRVNLGEYERIQLVDRRALMKS